MTRPRLYLRKDLDEEELGVWIHDRIMPVPEGLGCEADDCDGELWEQERTGDMEAERPLARSYSYVIKDGQVCYAYICNDCGERCNPEYLADNPYPVTAGGYAVVPKHCS